MNDARNTADRGSGAAGGRGGRQTRPAGEMVATTLAANPDRTATELAELAGLGNSTVTKALAALEAAGRARRHTPAAAGDARAHGRRPASRWRITPTAVAADALDGDDSGPARAARLGKGELCALVLAYLAAHPDTDLGPTTIGKSLRRSQGAVANCLTKLVQAGNVTRTSDKPSRYRLAR